MLMIFSENRMNPSDDISSQQSEKYYSAKSQFSEQSMSVADAKDNEIIDALETEEKTDREVRKTVIENGGQSDMVQVNQQDGEETDPKEKVIKMFSDKTEANMLSYILNTKP